MSKKSEREPLKAKINNLKAIIATTDAAILSAQEKIVRFQGFIDGYQRVKMTAADELKALEAALEAKQLLESGNQK